MPVIKCPGTHKLVHPVGSSSTAPDWWTAITNTLNPLLRLLLTIPSVLLTEASEYECAKGCKMTTSEPVAEPVKFELKFNSPPNEWACLIEINVVAKITCQKDISA